MKTISVSLRPANYQHSYRIFLSFKRFNRLTLIIIFHYFQAKNLLNETLFCLQKGDSLPFTAPFSDASVPIVRPQSCSGPAISLETLYSPTLVWYRHGLQCWYPINEAVKFSQYIAGNERRKWHPVGPISCNVLVHKRHAVSLKTEP